MMECVCGCKRMFEPKRSNQKYLNSRHRDVARNRRHPLVRVKVRQAARLKAQRERVKARNSMVTQLGPGVGASRKPAALYVAGNEFSHSWEAGAERVVVGARPGRTPCGPTWREMMERIARENPEFVLRLCGWSDTRIRDLRLQRAA